MTAYNSDNISRRHKQELAKLRGGLQSFLPRLVLFAICSLVLWGATLIIAGDGARFAEDLRHARTGLTNIGTSWTEDLLHRQETLHAWLASYSFAFEHKVFTKLSQLILQSAVALGATRQDDPSTIADIYIALHFGLLRVAFLCVACFRLWCLALIAAAVSGFFSWRVYRKPDILGQTGNGRLFYSGIRASLEDADVHGAPKQIVRGLACPSAVSHAVARKSSMAKILERYSALNETNLALVAILLKHANLPAYVAEKDEQALLENTFEGGGLASNAELLLETTLSLHARYRRGEVANPKSKTVAAATPAPRISAKQYQALLSLSLDRVLTAGLSRALAEISPASLATVVLGYESGKVLGYGFEAGKWYRKSNFIQLSARAVIHSLEHFGTDYDTDTRSTIRRALIYASRKSAFAAVTLPVDLSVHARAARQWTELLMACPHELQAASDAVELVGIVAEAQHAWADRFILAVGSSGSAETAGGFATHTNLLLLPLGPLLNLLRSVVSAETITRLAELTQLLYEKQRVLHAASSVREETHATYSENRYLAPLSTEEIMELTKNHALKTEDLKDWSALRVVLN